MLSSVSIVQCKERNVNKRAEMILNIERTAAKVSSQLQQWLHCDGCTCHRASSSASTLIQVTVALCAVHGSLVSSEDLLRTAAGTANNNSEGSV